MKKEVKILFLDIDGVLNSASTAFSPLGIRDIDEDKLLLLKEIIDKTKAKIILISSWKEKWYSNKEKKPLQSEEANYLDERFLALGLTISGKVPDLDYGGRGKAIARYLSLLKDKGMDITHFAILDDHLGDYEANHLKDHLVKTSFRKGGLTKDKAKKVTALLG